jgi:hypothetical protein
MSTTKPYVITSYSDPVGEYATIAEVISRLKEKPVGGLQIHNSELCDGDCIDGHMVFYDGLTEDEREALEDAGIF